MLPEETALIQFSKAVFYLIVLELAVLASAAGLFFALSRRSLVRLHSFYPGAVKLLQGKSSGAAVIKVPDLAGDLMDVEVPLYRIEKIRRSLPDFAPPEIQLWLAILVCAAYGEIKSFRDEIVMLIEQEREGKGLQKLDLAALCRFSISPYLLFRIINCLLLQDVKHPDMKSLKVELTKFIPANYIRHDVAMVTGFRSFVSSFRRFGMLLAALAVCALMLFDLESLPEAMLLFLLPVLTCIALLLSVFMAGVVRKISDPLSCRDITNDLRKDMPLLIPEGR